MIPDRFHFVWMGRNFPFVYRLAVESALQAHPGSECVIHFQAPPEGNPDWEALRRKAEMRPLDPVALASGPGRDEILPVLDSIPESYPAGRSNVLRYLILHREGGIYLDFDTLTLRSFSELRSHPAFVGEEEVFRCDDDRVAGRYTWDFPLMAALFGLSYGISYANARWLGTSPLLDGANRLLMKAWSARKLNNAVLGAEPGNGFFARVLAMAPNADPGLRYALGPMLMNAAYATDAAAQVRRLDKDVFYAVPPSQTYRFFHGRGPALPEAALAVHWCSSNHRRLARELTRRDLESPRAKSLFARLARQVLERGI